MPRYVRRRRSGPKRKSAMRKRVGLRRKASSKGFLTIKRKLPEIYVRNSAIAGAAAITDPTGTCVTLGAPIADAFGGTYSIPFSLKFRMDQVINSTDITNLCDAYKLKRVQVGMTFMSTQASVSSIPVMPNVTWIQDHDDATVPGSVNELREKMGSKMKTFGFNRLLNISVVPRVADTIFNNGILSAYAIAKPQWINSTYNAVEHYAIKGILSNVNLSASGTVTTGFKFDITATVQGKDFQ